MNLKDLTSFKQNQKEKNLYRHLELLLMIFEYSSQIKNLKFTMNIDQWMGLACAIYIVFLALQAYEPLFLTKIISFLHENHLIIWGPFKR